MKVYRMTRAGFIEEINTDGSYKPVGWSRTKAEAKRRGVRHSQTHQKIQRTWNGFI